MPDGELAEFSTEEGWAPKGWVVVGRAVLPACIPWRPSVKVKKTQTKNLCFAARTVRPYFPMRDWACTHYTGKQNLNHCTAEKSLCWVFVVAWGLLLLQPCGWMGLLWWMGLIAHDIWGHSSPTSDQTCAPCTGRQILNPWTTREVAK